jgi:hypothetical protein
MLYWKLYSILINLSNPDSYLALVLSNLYLYIIISDKCQSFIFNLITIILILYFIKNICIYVSKYETISLYMLLYIDVHCSKIKYCFAYEN